MVIHSRWPDDAEVAEFCRAWRVIDRDTPVVAIPTTYHQSSAAHLERLGVNAAVYASHLIRASIQAMQEVLDRIYADVSSAAMEGSIAPLSSLFDLTGTDKLIDDQPAAEQMGRPGERGPVVTRG